MIMIMTKKLLHLTQMFAVSFSGSGLGEAILPLANIKYVLGIFIMTTILK